MTHSDPSPPVAPIPLPSRRLEWLEYIVREPTVINGLLNEHGSPLNLLCTKPFAENLAKIQQTFEELELPGSQVHYAMKANKCAKFAECAVANGAGVDVASLTELRAAVGAGARGDLITVTGVVKSDELIAEAIEADAILVADHVEEILRIAEISQELTKPGRLSIRLAGFTFENEVLESRFGFLIENLHELSDLFKTPDRCDWLRWEGLHFHLSGYSPFTRRNALQQCLDLVPILRDLGHNIQSIDIGGGFPVRYLDDKSSWDKFFTQSESDPSEHYPYWNEWEIEGWLQALLGDSGIRGDQVETSPAEQCRALGITLHCEPGRFLLSSSGATVTRIAVVKQATGNRTAVVCDMNGTQIRPSKGDFLIDPIHLPSRLPTSSKIQSTNPSGYHIYGRYCSENDVIYRRPVGLSEPPSKGDILIFPNTAGYHMHFMETEGHGYELARNIFVSERA